jgi:DNA-binding PadR family transcriptional regulator
MIEPMKPRDSATHRLSSRQRNELHVLAEIIRQHHDWLWRREHREMLARMRRRIVQQPHQFTVAE